MKLVPILNEFLSKDYPRFKKFWFKGIWRSLSFVVVSKERLKNMHADIADHAVYFAAKAINRKDDRQPSIFPLYKNHDGTKLIGTMEFSGGEVWVNLIEGHALSQDQIFDTFGNVSIEVFDMFGHVSDHSLSGCLIKRFRIREWNVGPFMKYSPTNKQGD